MDIKSETQYGGRERRQFKRIARQFVISVGIRIAGEPTYWDMVSVKNLSAGGALFIYDKELAQGAFLDFKISSNLIQGSVRCSGVVVRCTSKANAIFKEVAAIFTDIDAKEKEVLNRAIEASGGE